MALCCLQGKVRLSDIKQKRIFLFYVHIDAGHLELPRVDPRGDGGGVGHDGTDAGCPVGLRSGGSPGDMCRC